MTLLVDRRDAPPSNVDGQSISITLWTTQKPWGPIVMPIVFAITRAYPRALLRDMDALSFISFASWSLVRRIPYNGPPQRLRRLRFAHLFFEVSFNGGWDQYVDSSVRILTNGMRTFWSSSLGFPGPLPARGFKAFFRRHELPSSHYYCAYPDGSATIVLDALALQERFAAFQQEVAGHGPEQFQAAYTSFLTEVQRKP